MSLTLGSSGASLSLSGPVFRAASGLLIPVLLLLYVAFFSPVAWDLKAEENYQGRAIMNDKIKALRRR